MIINDLVYPSGLPEATVGPSLEEAEASSRKLYRSHQQYFSQDVCIKKLASHRLLGRYRS